jgi:hypothetical protein
LLDGIAACFQSSRRTSAYDARVFRKKMEVIGRHLVE